VTPGCAIRGYVFDAYGTLFDVHSVVEAGRTITSDPMTLSTIWRQKQLEYLAPSVEVGREPSCQTALRGCFTPRGPPRVSAGSYPGSSR